MHFGNDSIKMVDDRKTVMFLKNHIKKAES